MNRRRTTFWDDKRIQARTRRHVGGERARDAPARCDGLLAYFAFLAVKVFVSLLLPPDSTPYKFTPPSTFPSFPRT